MLKARLSGGQSAKVEKSAYVQQFQELKFSPDAVRLFALVEQHGAASFGSALRLLGMPYGDVGRARDELMAAGVIEARKSDGLMVPAGGEK